MVSDDVIVELLRLLLIFMWKLWLMVIGFSLVWLMLVGMIVWLVVIFVCMNFGVMFFGCCGRFVLYEKFGCCLSS